MKGIPVQTVIDENSIKRLDETFAKGFGKSSVMKFFGEFTEFLEHSNLVVFGPDQVEIKSVANSFYLRNLIDQAGTGRKNIRIIKSATIEPSKLETSHQDQLMNVLISNQDDKNSTFFNDWLRFKIMPEGWDSFSNNRKTTILVGGKSSIFKSWEDFGLKKFPVKSIVIIDSYLLKEKDEIEINLPKIIDGLVNHENRDYPVNIILIVGDEVNKRFDFNSYVSRNSKIISSMLIEKYQNMNINLSVAYVKDDLLHDRFIFTNYYYMDAGRGFNLYTGKEKINSTKPNKVTLKFLSSPVAFAEYEEAIKEYCDVLFKPKALLRVEGSLDGNEILDLIKR